ncbi:hypothetical protein B0H17DRAFT_1145218 [Mycena rosella]|uniref:Uncharacterized protein n=1 Tax=Mycena rosella TaxID=1033263 RepID=A0AAD7CRN0_MYCRO|nr:hypothetical protein B0H17DRAFT_1145218 [Mycena rosella]
MNSQNSSHYQEHTRQQDGWTVLAPQPDPDNELPPPYTLDPEAASAPALAPPVPVVALIGMGTLLAFEIPTNSNVVAVAPSTRTRKYGHNIAFAAGYVEICQVMGLDPMTTHLGYKWDNERMPVIGWNAWRTALG